MEKLEWKLVVPRGKCFQILAIYRVELNRQTRMLKIRLLRLLQKSMLRGYKRYIFCTFMLGFCCCCCCWFFNLGELFSGKCGVGEASCGQKVSFRLTVDFPPCSANLFVYYILVSLMLVFSKLLELSMVELRKLRVNLQKVQQQNVQLAQANSQMLAVFL